MQYRLYVLCLIVLASCKSTEQGAAVEKVYSHEPNDSAGYKHLKYNFYLNKAGQLCERKLALARDRDSACHCEFIVYYDSAMAIYTEDAIITKPLSAIVDVASYEELVGTLYSKDKNNVYCFFSNSDGGNRSIVKHADPLTFKPLCEYRWGIDKNFVYHENDRVEGINTKSLQILHSHDTADHFVEYIKDDKQVFYGHQLVKGADAASFKIIANQGWDAADKNYKYISGARLEQVVDNSH